MVTSVLKGATREAALQRLRLSALGSRLSALELPEWGLQLPQGCRHLREDTALPFPN